MAHQSRSVVLSIFLVGWLALAGTIGWAQTSRMIQFSNLATSLSSGTQEVVIVLFDQDGNPLLFEPQTVTVADGVLSFVFGATLEGGLNPSLFPAASTRIIDVVRSTGESVLTGGAQPLFGAPYGVFATFSKNHTVSRASLRS